MRTPRVPGCVPVLVGRRRLTAAKRRQVAVCVPPRVPGLRASVRVRVGRFLWRGAPGSARGCAPQRVPRVSPSEWAERHVRSPGRVALGRSQPGAPSPRPSPGGARPRPRPQHEPAPPAEPRRPSPAAEPRRRRRRPWDAGMAPPGPLSLRPVP